MFFIPGSKSSMRESVSQSMTSDSKMPIDNEGHEALREGVLGTLAGPEQAPSLPPMSSAGMGSTLPPMSSAGMGSALPPSLPPMSSVGLGSLPPMSSALVPTEGLATPSHGGLATPLASGLSPMSSHGLNMGHPSLGDGSCGEVTDEDYKNLGLSVKKGENCLKIGLSLFPLMADHEKDWSCIMLG